MISIGWRPWPISRRRTVSSVPAAFRVGITTETDGSLAPITLCNEAGLAFPPAAGLTEADCDEVVEGRRRAVTGTDAEDLDLPFRPRLAAAEADGDVVMSKVGPGGGGGRRPPAE